MNDKPQAMFLTPTVDSLSEAFQEKYKISFFITAGRTRRVLRENFDLRL